MGDAPFTARQAKGIVRPEHDVPSDPRAVGNVHSCERRALGMQSESDTPRRLVEVQIFVGGGHVTRVEKQRSVDVREDCPSRLAVDVEEVLIVELKVMERTKGVVPAKSRQEVERDLVAGADVAEHGPPTKRQYPATVGQREEMRGLGLVLIEAEDAGRAIRVGRQRGPITSTARRMTVIVAVVGNHIDHAV